MRGNSASTIPGAITATGAECSSSPAEKKRPCSTKWLLASG